VYAACEAVVCAVSKFTVLERETDARIETLQMRQSTDVESVELRARLQVRSRTFADVGEGILERVQSSGSNAFLAPGFDSPRAVSDQGRADLEALYDAAELVRSMLLDVMREASGILTEASVLQRDIIKRATR
jgi:hypothetical protein